ncbi:MAG: TerB N-terminal domain-containing protein [Clostridia bacterium]|nr:TerB N-terminal domain-containing protein [Clostridia bacterium]
MSPIYRDIPIPPRSGAASRSAAPPDGFAVHFGFEQDELVMEASLAGSDEIPLYEGRGRFRFEGSDEHFTVSSFSLIDPFLWQHRCISPRSFKIVLRVILPKLVREGIRLTCALTLSDHPPVRIEVGSLQSDGSAQVRARWAFPRSQLRGLSGLDEYVLGGETLYRASMAQIREIPQLSEDWQTLSGNPLRILGRICDRMGVFFEGDGVTALRALGRGMPLRTDPTPTMPLRPERPVSADTAASPEVSETFRDFQLSGEPAFVPTIERKIELPAPTLVSAELFAASRQQSSKYAFFFNEARTLKDLRGSAASPQSFTCYWPTYSSMNRAQKSWYFYWRGQFLDGNILKTDLAYIFVAIYELINNTVAEPPEALERLVRLWESYREAFPYLDRVMPTWCVDYMLVNSLGTDFDALHERIPFPIDGQTHLVELFCNRRMQEGLHTLSLPVLSTLSGYAMDKSRFIAGREELAAQAVRTALLTAEAHLQQTEERGVFDFFKPPLRSIQWETFRGAVCSQFAGRRVKLTYLPYAQNEQFREWLANILRHTENLLRKSQRFPGRLRCTKMPAGLEDAIARALNLQSTPLPKSQEHTEAPAAPAAPREPIRIDLDRARALEDASWENTRRLLEALGNLPDEDAADAVPAAPDPTAPEPTPVILDAVPAEPMPAPVIEDTTPEQLPDAASDDDPYAALLQALTPLQMQVLQALLDEDDTLAGTLCTAEMTFPDAVAEEINVLADEYLGDLLIDSATLRVYEDYAPCLLERMN